MEEKEKNNSGKKVADKLKEQHSQISEETELFRVVLPYIGGKKAYNDIKKVIDFFDQNINAHFAYEEQNVFKTILVAGEPEIKQVVSELQQEHIVILGKYHKLKDIVLKHGFSFQDEEVKDDFVGLSKDIIGLILHHARKEDEKLIPWLESEGINIKVDFIE